MLQRARQRFAGNKAVEVATHDLSDPLPNWGTFDVIVSSLAIHHLVDERKRELYDLFGLEETALAPLQFLCEHGSGWSPEEISELLGDGRGNVGFLHVSNTLKWAEMLGLVRRGPDDWDLDAGVKQVLSMD